MIPGTIAQDQPIETGQRAQLAQALRRNDLEVAATNRSIRDCVLPNRVGKPGLDRFFRPTR